MLRVSGVSTNTMIVPLHLDQQACAINQQADDPAFHPRSQQANVS